MLLDFAFCIVGIFTGFALGHFTKRSTAKGETLFLSADAYELSLIEKGQLCNVRASKSLDVANAAHGETGLEVVIANKF